MSSAEICRARYRSSAVTCCRAKGHETSSLVMEPHQGIFSHDRVPVEVLWTDDYSVDSVIAWTPRNLAEARAAKSAGRNSPMFMERAEAKSWWRRVSARLDKWLG